MKTLMLLVATAVALGGCASLPKVDPATIKAASDAFIANGCRGSASFSAGGATAAGASPGSAHAEFTLAGACDPANAPHPTPPTPQPVAPAP